MSVSLKPDLFCDFQRLLCTLWPAAVGLPWGRGELRIRDLENLEHELSEPRWREA